MLAARKELFLDLFSCICVSNSDVISSGVPIYACQCFTNLLNRNVDAVALFSDPQHGINGLEIILYFIQFERSSSVLYYVIRLLHMLAASR